MVYTVKRLEAFSDWLKGLKDGQTQQRLIKRLRKAQLGNLGNTAIWRRWAKVCTRCASTSGLGGACTLSSEAIRCL